MAWQQTGGFDPSQQGVGQNAVNGVNGMGMQNVLDADAAPPPPDDGDVGAGWTGTGYEVPPPENDIEDPFGVPPPPESLLNSLVFDEPDSQANILRDPQTQNLKAGTFAKIIERLTHPTVHGTCYLHEAKK